MPDAPEFKRSIHITVKPEIRKLAEKMAEKDDRSLSNWFSVLIKDTWEAHKLNKDS